MTTVQEQPAQEQPVQERPGQAPPDRAADHDASIRSRLSRFRYHPPPTNRAPRSRVPKPRSTTHATVAWSAAGLVVLVIWTILYALVLTSYEHSHDQSVLYAKFRQQLAEATAPIGGAITPGEPVAVMNMPSAGIRDEVIVEGTSSDDLTNGPGHKRDSPLPGQAGVSLVYGRSQLFGGPFGDVASVKAGDTVTMRTGLGLSKYVVDRVRRAGDPFSPALAVGAGRLTLVTSEGSGWRGGWAPSRTVYVDATLASKTVGTPSGRPQAVPQYETAMQGDTGALFVLVLWLPLLLGGAVACVWAQHRWGKRQTWVVGVPVLVAALWGTSEAAVQLLPNLM